MNTTTESAVVWNFEMQLLDDLTRFEFDELQSYAAVLEDALKKESQRLAEEVKKRTAKMTEEAKSEYYDFAADEFSRLQEVFPRVLRYSLFVHTYSLFEKTLLRIADFVRQSQGLELALNDLRDDGITRAKTYLKKVANLPFPDTTPEWQDITALNSLRNLIVHSMGHLAEDHPKKGQIESLMKKWAGEISLDNTGNFDLSDQFAIHAIDTCRTFLAQIFAISSKRPTVS